MKVKVVYQFGAIALAALLVSVYAHAKLSGISAAFALSISVATFCVLAMMLHVRYRGQPIHELESMRMLTAAIAHDIKGPLQSILGAVKVISRKPGAPEQHQLLLIISNASIALARMIDDMECSVNDKPMTLSLAPVSLSEWSREIANLYAPKVIEKGLAWNLQENFKEGCVINCDRQRLTQCVDNLVMNALRHTQTGFIHIAVDLAQSDTVMPGDRMYQLSVCVSDSGGGVSAADQKRIFDPFVQVRENLDSKVGSAGLGLAIVSAIAKSFGGSVTLVSELNNGSQFSLTLPVAVSSDGH
jgi:hypothetical protein